MIRTSTVQLATISAVAYRQKLVSGGAGITIWGNNVRQPGLASISKTSGEAIPTANTPLEYYPPEAFAEAIKLSRESAGELLSDVKAQDIYTNEEGQTALTIRFFFSSSERTLTKQELQPTIEALISALSACNLVFKS